MFHPYKYPEIAICVIVWILLQGCGQRKVESYTGPKGDAGAVGAQGPQGNAGTDAKPCTVEPTSDGAIISCPDGSTKKLTNGVDGLPGTPGTVVTTVQFCPGYAVSYPTSFPEFGFCINNKLYAVYWNGTQAFMAEIPPGTYNSTSPQMCTFTVLNSCQIQ